MPTDASAIMRGERLRQAGEWLRDQRNRRGWTGRHLASLIGITPIQVSNYERGRDGISDDRAERIARAFGMDVIDVRANLGLWVPDGHKPGESRMVSPEEAIRADPTLRPDQKETALGMLALIRGQAQPPAHAPAHAPADAHDPDAPPRRPGHRPTGECR